MAISRAPKSKVNRGSRECASDRARHLDPAMSGRGTVPPLSHFTHVDRAAVFQVIAAAFTEHDSAVESQLAAAGSGDEGLDDECVRFQMVTCAVIRPSVSEPPLASIRIPRSARTSPSNLPFASPCSDAVNPFTAMAKQRRR